MHVLAQAAWTGSSDNSGLVFLIVARAGEFWVGPCIAARVRPNAKSCGDVCVICVMGDVEEAAHQGVEKVCRCCV